MAGWPDNRIDLPKQLQPYWAFIDELSVESSLVPKGERVIIPNNLTPCIVSKLHEGHQGVEKSELRSKDCVYWFNINKELEEIVSQCPTCQQHRKSQIGETLLSHAILTRPWKILGTDLFQFNGDNYLVIADYYSIFPFVRTMLIRCMLKLLLTQPKSYSQSKESFKRSWVIMDHSVVPPSTMHLRRSGDLRT